MNKTVKNLAVAGLMALVAGFAAPRAAQAHDVPCPVCGLKVVQATKTQDNEVVLRYGKKKIEYRCVYCAISDSAKYEGDLAIYAPSEEKGKPVILTRTSGIWAAVKESDGKLVPEEGVVFVNAFSSHPKCAMLSRAFHGREGFDKYVKASKAEGAKALSLQEMVAAATKH